MTLKRIFILIVILAIARFTSAQNVGINATGAAPDASAILDVASTSKGMLMPRVALTATNAAGPVSSPTTSLLVYNTATAGSSPNNVVPGYYYWNGGSWTPFQSASNTAWTLTGNSGLNGATNFIGTTDDIPLVFKTYGNSFLEFGNRGTLGLTQGFTDYDNATEKVTYVRSALQFEAAGASFYKPKMYTDADGNFRVKGSSAGTDYFEFGSTGTANNGGFEFIIGDDGDEPILFKSYHYINGMSEIMRLQSGRMAVGSNSFDGTNPEKLLIDAGATSSYNLMTGKGSIDNYLQINIKNSSNTANASSDVVATASNGSESVNYIDMGINSGAYTNVSYPVLAGANTAYLYATGNDFVIGNTTTTKDLVFFTGGTAATNERMRINAAGNIGIGSTPSFKLDVNGTIRTGKASATNGSLVFSNSTNANTVTINSNTTSASYALSLPAAQGAASTVLVNNGSGTLTWNTVAAVAGAWSTLGNAGTNPATNFLGTTDNQALVFKMNNAQVQRFEANSVALGLAATTNNSLNAYAIGSSAAVGFNHPGSYAIGNSAAANSDNAFAIGNSSAVNGNSAFAIGNGATSNSVNGVAVGTNATVAYSITDAIAIGTNALANSNNSIAIGGHSTLASKTAANANNAIAIGVTTLSNSANAIAIGTGATVGYSLTAPVAIGNGVTVNGSNGVAIGNGSTTSSASNTTAIGSATAVSGNNSTAIGNAASVTGANSTAVGYNTTVTQSNAVILGDLTNSALSVGIGSQAFNSTGNREKLLVDMGVTSSVNAIVGKGTNPSYLQLNIQNLSNGNGASSDVVATADNGNETSNYVDMGINSSTNSSGVMGGANDSYLYNIGQDFLIGTGSASKSLIFLTGGTSETTNERMRIDGTGKVGIGKAVPTEALDINGNLRFSGAFKPNNLAGNAGEVLVSSGAGAAPTWASTSGILNTISWGLGGNSVSAENNLGTTTNFALPFITNNTEKMRISATGDVAIGISTFTSANPEQLLVNAGTPAVSTDFQNVIVGKGNTNSYAQLNIQNINAGNGASSDVVATADNGSELINYVDMGINSSTNNSGIMGGINDSYLYNMGQDFLIGTGTAARSLLFLTGGTSETTNERMRIDGTGKVGIGTVANTSSAVNSTLEVVGSVGFGIVTTSTTLTLDATNHTVIITSSTPTINFPAAAASNKRRIYVIVNQTGTARTTSSYLNFSAAGTTTIAANSSITIQSDGTNWYRIQ